VKEKGFQLRQLILSGMKLDINQNGRTDVIHFVLQKENKKVKIRMNNKIT